MANKANNMVTKRFVMRKSLIGKKAIITFTNTKKMEENISCQHRISGQQTFENQAKIMFPLLVMLKERCMPGGQLCHQGTMDRLGQQNSVSCAYIPKP